MHRPVPPAPARTPEPTRTPFAGGARPSATVVADAIALERARVREMFRGVIRLDGSVDAERLARFERALSPQSPTFASLHPHVDQRQELQEPA